MSLCFSSLLRGFHFYISQAHYSLGSIAAWPTAKLFNVTLLACFLRVLRRFERRVIDAFADDGTRGAYFFVQFQV